MVFFKGPRSLVNSARYTFGYEWVSPSCHRTAKTPEMNELDRCHSKKQKNIQCPLILPAGPGPGFFMGPLGPKIGPGPLTTSRKRSFLGAGGWISGEGFAGGSYDRSKKTWITPSPPLPPHQFWGRRFNKTQNRGLTHF